jgi:hypothetical protein
MVNDLVYYGGFTKACVENMKPFERTYHLEQVQERVKEDREFWIKLMGGKKEG